MQISITNMGRFRLVLKLSTIATATKLEGSIRGRIVRKMQLKPDVDMKVLDNNNVLVSEPALRKSYDLEESEVDLLLPILEGGGWQYADDNEDIGLDGHPLGWVPDLESQIKTNRKAV